MKKLLILCLSLSLMVACKDKKDTRRDDTKTTTEKDDYRKTDDRDSKESDSKESDDKNTNDNKTSNWSSKDVNDFVSNCTSSAVNGGMQQVVAERYCECMQVKMATLYPDVVDAGQLTQADLETPAMKRMIQDCLKN